MTKKTEILIVEDERVFAEAYGELFSGAGYFVSVARNADAALKAFRARKPTVVLLDIMLPGGNGYTICRKMRDLDALVPIVFNTALDSPEDIAKGLETGGDDYILKTASDDERLARVARAVKRYEAFLARAGKSEPEIEIGECRIDFARLVLKGAKGREERLTRTEADILRLLNSARGSFFQCDEIIGAVRGEGFVCNEGAVYTHISRLRKKLGRKAGALLVSHSGVGYGLLP